MSQFSFFPQADGSDPLADALSQYRRSKKTLGQRSESEESGMQFGRAVAGLLNDLDPLSWVVSPSSVMDDIGDFGTFIDRVKTIETKKQLDSEMASGKLTPQEMLLRQQQIEVLDKMISSEAQQAAAATQEEIAEKGVVGMFGQGVKAGVTQGVVSSMRGFTNLMPVDGDAFWSGAQRETGMATPEDSVSGKIGQAVGSGLFSAASFTVNPYLGTAVMGLQGYGGGIEAYDQAYQYGLTTGDYSQFEKITSGLTSAAIEAATETLGYGIASRLAKTGVAQWFAQPGARAVMGTVGKMYAGEALEEGLVPILQNGVKMTGWTGMQPAEWKEAFGQAATDAFYGGFGGFGAAGVNVPAEIVRRQQTNKLLREAGSKYADESFVEEIAPKRAAALQAMTPEERALESDQAEQSLMQASADLGKAKENVGAVQAQLIAKQQELSRARRGRDRARIQALEAEVATGEAGLETARQNAASIAADYAASQFNYLTALASMSAGAPTVQMTVDDVLSSQQYNPATSATTAQKAVEQQLTRLGFKVQYYDGGQQGDTRPAFFSPQTPDTVYLRADGNMKFSEMMGLAMHELTHWVQFNDSGLWSAMRETMDDQTMLAAATKYWQQAAGIDPQVRQSLAQIIAEADGKPISGDDVAQLESRMGRSLVESEGAAKMIENGAAALFRGEAVPGWFGQLVTRMGLRGRSAMSALKLYRGLQEAAKNNKGYTPGKVGFTIDAAQRGLEVMRRARLQAAGAVAAPPATPQPQAAPAPATTPAPAQPAPAAPAAPAAAPAPAPAPTAAAPAPAAPAPSPAAAAPAPAASTRAAIDAALSAFNSAPNPEFFAPSANEVAAAELALEQRASEDAAAGRPNPYEGVTGDEMARLMTYVDAVDGGLLPGKMVTEGQRKIAKEMRRKIRRTVGTISARGKDVPETIDSASIIDSIIPVATSQQWKNMRDFKRTIQAKVRKAAAEAGIDLSVDSPRVNEYLRRMMVKEVRAAVQSNSNAVGWYDEKVRKALAVVSLIHPELANDRMAQFAFKWALAVTSNGAKVKDNFENALKAYESYKANGVMPTDIGVGKPAGAINNAMQLFNDLVAKHGMDRVEQFMSTKHTVREIKEFTGIKPNGENIDTVLYGAAVAGPKIGNGFFANLYGHFEQLTMDRWFMRTWGRWSGSLIQPRPELVIKRRKQMRQVLAQMDDATREEFFKAINVKPRAMTMAPAVEGQQAEVELTDAAVDKIAEAIKKASVKKAQRDIINEIGVFPPPQRDTMNMMLADEEIEDDDPRYSFGDELRKIGNGLSGAKDGQKEAPASGSERARIRKIAQAALAELNKEFPDLTMADLQASIWYPEKRLYDSSKTKESKAAMQYDEGGAPDYETAARAVAKSRNVSDDQIRQVTERIDNDIRSERTGSTRRVAGTPDARTVSARAAATTTAERGAGDRGGVGAARSLAPLADAPIVTGATGPDAGIVAAAERYAASVGIDLKRQAFYADVDLDRAGRIAAAFDAMPHDPTDPAVVEAYDALIDQTVAQYRALEEAGYKFWFFDEKTDPYDGKPWMALRDLRQNKTMAVFSTQAGFGTLEEIDTSGNPLLVDTGIRWPYGSPDGPLTPVLANDLFRAVHDAFGHSLEGAGFRARGEENAWQAHVRLFFGPAVGAMTTETRGQNSWLNFGPYGEQNQNAGVLETVFAPQKTGLMPEWTWTEGRVPDMQDQPTGPGGGQPAVSTASARITPQQDAQYMDAVKRGDMDTAQRMVDAAARAAGYIYRVFHGTNGPMFRQFSKDMGGAKTGAESAMLGIFATDNRRVAQSYADNPGMGSMFDLALGGPLSELRKQAMETGRGKELKDAYDAAKREYDAALQRGRARVREDVANSEVIADLKKAGFESNINSFIDTLATREMIDGEWLKSPEIVAAEENLIRAEEPLQEFLRDVIVSSIPNRRVLGMYAKMTNPAIYDAGGVTPAEFALTPKIQKAMKDGHDGVIFKNLIDPVEPSTHYVVFDPSQFKSSDPVTLDEAGNVIPLSQRFNAASPSIMEARQRPEDLAYQIGRRSGQVAGVARGRQQRETEVREAQREAEARARAVEETRRRAKEQKREQRIRERAKRAALAGRMQARLARLSAEIRRRQRRDGERMEDFSRRALREMMREAQTASGEGYRQAKTDLSRLKREAIELINLLPPKARSRYLPRIAELSSAAGVLKVADSVVRDMTRNEARVTFNRLRGLQQQFTARRGIRNDTRDQAMPLIQSGMSMLGGDRLMGYTDMADMVQRIGAARQLMEEARDLYEQDREAWREGRAERQQERADAADVLAENINRLDELPDSRLWSTGRTAGFVGKFFAANSDIHTLAEIIDGAIDGPIHEMIARLAAGKNAMNLDRRRIDQTMDGLLQQAGYSSVDDYAQRAAGMGGVAATDVMDVMLGGQSRRITRGEAMSLAAMDDDTLALLFDENDPEFAGSPITFLRDGGKLPLRVTRQEVEAIRARLSAGQIALIDGLKGMIDADIRQRAFDVHYAQFGRMPEAIPGYYPRRRLGDSISGDTVDVNATPGNVIMTMLDNAGFTRQRVASRAPLVVDDLVRTIDGHVDQGLRLIHLSDPLRFGITVLRDANVKSAMESRLGAKSNDQMRKLLMNGVGLSGRPTGDFIDNLNSNVSGALLLINPKTWFRQLGGIFRLASEFDMGDWASGSRSSIALTPAQRSAMIDRIEQDSGYFFDRHRRSQVGLFAGIIGDPRQNRERMMVMLRAVGSNLRSAVDEATQANFRSMLEDLNAGRSNVLTILRSFDWALRGIDRQVMLAGYMSARQSLSRTDPAMAEQDAHLAAIALAERAFRRTQNVSDPMDDTVFAAEQKFNKGYGRLLFPFSSDPLKAFNQARRAVANPDARAGTAFGITANILWSAAANPLSVGLAGLATGLWASDDEDDKLLKQAIVNQQAQRALERAAGDLAGSAFGYAGLILTDVYQAYRSYQDGYAPDAGVQLMPLQVVNESIRNFATGEYGAMAGDIATLAGIPVTTPIESIRRDIARVTPTPEKIRDALLAKKRGSGLTADEERRLKAAQQQVRLNKLQTAE